MKVKCLYNKGSFLPNDLLTSGWMVKETQEFHIDIGKEYVVYAIKWYWGYPWYAISDFDIYYPSFYPATLFDVIDRRLSRYWVFSFYRGEDSNSTYVGLVYPEWANDPYYYGALTDGDEKEVAIFRKYKQRMDVEFPDASVPTEYTAIVGNEKGWVLCPTCFEAWEVIVADGMTVCPQCRVILHNPLFEAYK